MRRSRTLLLLPVVTTAVLAPALDGAHGDERVAPRLQPAVSLPGGAQVPDVPTVQVPQAPPVQVPDVPAVQVPSAPPVQAPQAPAVRTPDVPAVQPPGAPAPGVRTPASVGGGAGGAGGAAGGVAGGGVATGGGAGGGGAAAAQGGAASGGAAGASSPARAGRDSGGSAGGVRTTKAGRKRDARGRRAARERRFRERVTRLEGCFGALSSDEKRVLSLRAGLGGESPQTVAQVAEALGVDGSEVRTTERGALRRLDAVHRAGGCGGGGGGRGGSAPIALSANFPRLQPALVLTTEARLVPAERLGRNEVAGVLESGGSTAGGGSAGPEPGGGSGLGLGPGRTSRPVATADGGAPVLPIVLTAALGLLVALAVARRQRRIPVAGATAGPAVGEAPFTPVAPVPRPAPPEAFARAVQARAALHDAPSTFTTSPGDTAAAPSASHDVAAAQPSPGDTAAAPGPPAASAAAGAAVGATGAPREAEPAREQPAAPTPPPAWQARPPGEDRDATVARRRSGGLLGAVKPAGEQAARAAGSATQRLLDIARRAREGRDRP